jgi:hypothetical protein
VSRRVLITGSRTWTDLPTIRGALREVWGDGTAVLVSGACPHGADCLAEQVWRQWGGHVQRHLADWARYGRSAGFRRNTEMVTTAAEVCLAFIRDNSAGPPTPPDWPRPPTSPPAATRTHPDTASPGRWTEPGPITRCVCHTVATLDRLGRTVRDTLNLIHELSERGIGVRNLADPIRIDSRARDDPMAQLAVVLLALFGQMERTYAIERAAHARAVATAKGRRVGRPVTVDAHKLAWAQHLREAGHTIAEIVDKTGIPRSSLYRHLPPRPPESVTAPLVMDVKDTCSTAPDNEPEPGRAGLVPHQPPVIPDQRPRRDQLLWFPVPLHRADASPHTPLRDRRPRSTLRLVVASGFLGPVGALQDLQHGRAPGEPDADPHHQHLLPRHQFSYAE